MGARVENLLRLLYRYGPVPARQWPLVAAMLGSSVARLPFRALEAVRFAQRRRLAPPTPTPVFIIGHWRTGTTHLHNLLACSPTFGYITPLASGLPDEILTLGTWLQPWLERALPEDRHVDRVAVRPDSPQEDEIPLANQQPLSLFHALYFPRRFRELAGRGIFLDGCRDAEIARRRRHAERQVAKITLHQGGRRLLLKNPVYTARIRELCRIWPHARFIHIRRNPYEVFVSTRHYYRHLLPMLALQDYDHVDLDDFILTTYRRLMRAYDEQSAELPPEQLAEVSYEALVERPLAVLETLHEQLALPDWDATRPRVAAYLERLGSYRHNRYALDQADVTRVYRAWGDYVERWGYRPPR